jgi:hypothetical protein
MREPDTPGGLRPSSACSPASNSATAEDMATRRVMASEGARPESSPRLCKYDTLGGKVELECERLGLVHTPGHRRREVQSEVRKLWLKTSAPPILCFSGRLRSTGVTRLDCEWNFAENAQLVRLVFSLQAKIRAENAGCSRVRWVLIHSTALTTSLYPLAPLLSFFWQSHLRDPSEQVLQGLANKVYAGYWQSEGD